MIREREGIKESKPKVPAYIVTFSDMVTLLLTFFVMLLTLAQMRDEELFHKGRESFFRAMGKCGLGVLPGRKVRPDLGDVKIKFFISNPDKTLESRTIDAKQEEIRRIFQKVDRSMTTIRSRIVGEKNNFSVTDIRFQPGSAALNEPAKKFLTKFCLDLQQARSGDVKLYVLGLAGAEATEKERWIVSAKRAQAVAGFLQEALPSGTRWPIYSWGAGPGGEWVQQDSPISSESQILIGILRGND